MNIFVLARDPYLAAKYHCDKHVVKMIIESGQMLSTALRFYGHSGHGLYKTSHFNHPCSVWVRQSRQNFEWLCCLMDGLLDEYHIRYGARKDKSHKCEAVFAEALRCMKFLPKTPSTPHPKCMPDYCIVPNVVSSYRNYYVLEKSHFAVWKFSKTPAWYLRGLNKE